jgi:hypothetical protein
MAGPVKHPCQALIVRYAPDPASGELLNVGVVVLSPRHGFMGSRFLDKWIRVTKAFPEADKTHLRRVASSIERSCERHFSTRVDQLPLQQPTEDLVVAFDAALPLDDASIIRSQTISGVTADPERTLNELFERYVAVRDVEERRVSRPDDEIWRGLSAVLRAKNVLHRLEPHVVRGRRHEEHFEHAWKNGHWSVAKSLSLDLLDPYDIRTKAASWCGRIAALDPEQHVDFHLLIGMPESTAPNDVRAAAEDGFGIMKEQLETRELAEVVPESDVDSLGERIAAALLGHEAAE